MRALTLLLFAAGCFGQPVRDDCQVRCGEGAACPDDYRCGADLHCHPAELDQPRECAAADGGPDPVCRAVRIAASTLNTCAVLSDGRAVCWGDNCHGELGNPEVPAGPDDCGAAQQSVSPVLVMQAGAPLAGVSDLALGLLHACALLDDGTVACWGSDSQGELGRGTEGGLGLEPAPVLGLEDIDSIETGWFHSCAVSGDGAGWCWGNNANGEIGASDWSGALDVRSTAEQVDTAESIEQISAGTGHSCAIVEGGLARCWGRNQVHQLGNSATCETIGEEVPVEVLRETDDMPIEDVTLINAGNNFSCAATRSPDQVWCWGENLRHKLGDDSCPECPDGYDVCLARQVSFTPDAPAVRVLTGGQFGCALLEGGDLWCWGSNDRGQLGVGSGETWLPPTRVMDDVVDVALGFRHACAIDQAGQVLCWGENQSGQIGDGTTDDASQPTPVAELCPR